MTLTEVTGVKPAESLWNRRLPLLLSLGYAVIGLLYIAASDRLLLMILADPDRLTAAQTLKGWGFVIVTAVLIYAAADYGIKRMRAAERERRLTDERFRHMIEITNEGVWMLDESGRTAFVNETMARLLGYEPREMQGRPFIEFVPTEFRRSVDEQIAERRKGKCSQYECQLTRRDGSNVWVIITSSPLYDDRNRFIGASKMVTDLTEQKKTEEDLRKSVVEQRRLLNELDHRVRNNLSSVLGLLQLARTGEPLADALAESVSGRVKAMSRAYSLLSSSGWSGQDLARLIGTLVPGEVRNRVALRGESLKVPAHQTGALAIMLHELFSNAIRHGAFSSDAGTVDVSWSRIEDDRERGTSRLEMEWTERGGPPIESEPTMRAGCRLIEGLAASDLRGRARLAFPRTGAHHRLEVKLFWRDDGTAEETPPGRVAATA